MECEFCGEDIEDKGLLVSSKDYEKHWVCSDCFTTGSIKGDYTIVHHWGYLEKKGTEDPKPEEG